MYKLWELKYFNNKDQKIYCYMYYNNVILYSNHSKSIIE